MIQNYVPDWDQLTLERDVKLRSRVFRAFQDACGEHQPGFTEATTAEDHFDLSVRAMDLSGSWFKFELANRHIHFAKRNRTAKRKEALIFAMTRRLLKLMLSTSFLIAAFSQYNKAFAAEVQIGKAVEKFGYLYVDSPKKYVFSYARAIESKTVFGVGIVTPTQITAENGLLVPSALIIDCTDVRGNFNLMQEMPAENVEKWALERMNNQAKAFCQLHKQFFKHSHW